jgi:hypothetical protein
MPIFGENIGGFFSQIFFTKTNVMIKFLKKTSISLSKNANIFAKFFGENIFNKTSIPDHVRFSTGKRLHRTISKSKMGPYDTTLLYIVHLYIVHTDSFVFLKYRYYLCRYMHKKENESNRSWIHYRGIRNVKYYTSVMQIDVNGITKYIYFSNLKYNVLLWETAYFIRCIILFEVLHQNFK